MSLVADFRTYLLTITGITNIVGTAGVYWQTAPEDTAFPYITYMLISEDREEARDLLAQCGLTYASYQVDCWHTGSSAIDTLAEAVRAAVDGYSGTMGSTTVQRATLAGRRHIAEAPQYAGEEVVDRIMCEVGIWFQESIPTF